MTTTSAIVNHAAYMEDRHFIRWAFGGQRLLWGDYVQVGGRHIAYIGIIFVFVVVSAFSFFRFYIFVYSFVFIFVFVFLFVFAVVYH